MDTGQLTYLLLCCHRLRRKSTGIWAKYLFIPFSQQNSNTCITNYMATVAGSSLQLKFCIKPSDILQNNLLKIKITFVSFLPINNQKYWWFTCGCRVLYLNVRSSAILSHFLGCNKEVNSKTMSKVFNSQIWGEELPGMSMMDHSHASCLSHGKHFLDIHRCQQLIYLCSDFLTKWSLPLGWVIFLYLVQNLKMNSHTALFMTLVSACKFFFKKFTDSIAIIFGVNQSCSSIIKIFRRFVKLNFSTRSKSKQKCCPAYLIRTSHCVLPQATQSVVAEPELHHSMK